MNSPKYMKKSTVPRILMATGLEENDVRHATGLVAPDPFCLLALGSRLHLLVSALEAARARTRPQSVADEGAMIDTIKRNPGSIGWVRKEPVDKQVRVVLVIKE